jgi:hypothetical protein
VFETYGKRTLNDKAVKKETRDEGTKEAPLPVDYYAAELSGDVWMRSTHPYTAADVDALAADVASAAMKTDLKKIYDAAFTMVGQDFAVDVARGSAAEDKCSARLLWRAAENSNCTANIKSVDIKRDVPCRIHPAAYAAVAAAAHEAEITQVTFSSSWRPMLGSMGHRSGRGLDIVVLSDTQAQVMLNREGLTSRSTADKNKDGIVDDGRGHKNITVDEQQAFNDWKKAEGELNSAAAELKRTTAASATADAALAKAQKANNADLIEKARHAKDQADKSKKDAADAVKKAEAVVPEKKAEWVEKVEEHQPDKVGKFRRALMKAQVVTQIIDPWYIDLNTRDKVAGVVNEQKEDEVQNRHKNHLHLTIFDAELKG